jgi:hypothetical protein
MAHSSTIRRTLFMHPAHRTIGVTGEGVAVGPYCRLDRFSTDDPAVAPIRVALLAIRLDSDACAALALFEQATHGRRDVQCRRVLLDAFDAGGEMEDCPNFRVNENGTVPFSAGEISTDADCMVVFGHGLHVVQHWSDLDATALVARQVEFDRLGATGSASACLNATLAEPVAPNASPGNAESMQIEPAAAACWHPVLEGVEPFVSRRPAAHCVRPPEGATVLLTGRNAVEVQPVAWTWRCPHGSVFSASIGSADDFRQPALVRLALNAVMWLNSVS